MIHWTSNAIIAARIRTPSALYCVLCAKIKGSKNGLHTCINHIQGRTISKHSMYSPRVVTAYHPQPKSLWEVFRYTTSVHATLTRNCANLFPLLLQMLQYWIQSLTRNLPTRRTLHAKYTWMTWGRTLPRHLHPPEFCGTIFQVSVGALVSGRHQSCAR